MNRLTNNPELPTIKTIGNALSPNDGRDRLTELAVQFGFELRDLENLAGKIGEHTRFIPVLLHRGSEITDGVRDALALSRSRTMPVAFVDYSDKEQRLHFADGRERR